MISSDQIYLLSLLDSIDEHPLLSELKVHFEPVKNLLPAPDPALLQMATSLAGGNAAFSVGRAKEPLFSCFDGLGIAAGRKGIRMPLRSFELSDSYFSYEEETANWLEMFQSDLRSSALEGQKDLRLYAETLLFILQKHTVNLASGYGDELPFYDFAKIKAAIAVCLNAPDVSEKPILLISGGISGIQSYLYDIVSKNASKNLKGRSYYVQMLSELVLQRVVHDLQLYQANVVYASGGGFLLLAPNNVLCRTQLEATRQEIEAELFRVHTTGLFMELASLEVAPTDLLEQSVATLINTLNSITGSQKTQKYIRQIMQEEPLTGGPITASSGYDFFFNPSEQGGETVRDAVTNEELDPQNRQDIYFIGNADPARADGKQIDAGESLVSMLTAHQIQIGRQLRQFQFSQLLYSNPLPSTQHTANLPLHLGLHERILPSGNAAEMQANSILYTINNVVFPEGASFAGVSGFRLYGGNDFPKIEVVNSDGKGDTVAKTASEMAGLEDDDREYIDSERDIKPEKFKRLGLLRMDVDGLGKTITEAFDKNKFPHQSCTLVAMSTVSRNLDYFFKGYLNTLWSGKQVYRDFILIVYAGGDDLFLYGRWNAVLELSADIRKAFRQWVGSNPVMTISGGVSVVGPKYPIVKAVEYAGNAEDEAKAHEYKPEKADSIPERKKDAITLFGYPLHWEIEYPVVIGLKEELVMHCGQGAGALPRSLLSKIIGYHEKAYPPDSGRRKRADLSWRWQLLYDIARMKDRNKKNQSHVHFLDELIKGIVSNRCDYAEHYVPGKYTFFSLLYIAAIWAGFEIRNM